MGLPSWALTTEPTTSPGAGSESSASWVRNRTTVSIGSSDGAWSHDMITIVCGGRGDAAHPNTVNAKPKAKRRAALAPQDIINCPTYGTGCSYGASWSATVALSPTTTSVISPGLRYVDVMRCTSAGVTASTRFT